jgi:excisionase family DNA binding protein
LWFDVNSGKYSGRLSQADGLKQSGLPISPRILRNGWIHLDDQVTCVSITCPRGLLLKDIDPGNINKVEVDFCLIKGMKSKENMNPESLLTFIFINSNPANPCPINVDARIAPDKHNYPNILHESRDRAYHKLLLRHCLAPGYQIWPDVMNSQEAAAYCRVKKRTIADWIKDGWIKASPGSKPRIRKDILDDYLVSS